ncbi:proton-conducting transporter transmembrane domain-containing protein [Vreelandella boliviensis]|uniref:NADH-quinone oxidoreductase subunit N n=1 Tax=Vreelandella boliviensis LC1 TaxID=1072583 RepID=A0A265DYD2_9GAMM|nr:proton-conducting transporter membrane subunit [Halomonas boliviensis]EHJ94289.1 NADH-quinone oxidoreductase subunit N [Halomonas boliviensis LC1]OZT74343.1 NADH-quinone oxidoreductase subunit N [Halomonas boliviensis LC1]
MLTLHAFGLAIGVIPVLLVILPLLLCLAAFIRLIRVKHQLFVGLPLITLGNILGAWHLGVSPEWQLGGWALPIGIRWALAPSTLALLSLTTVVACTAGLTAYAERAKQREYWTLWWLMWAALNTLWLSRDLFNVYVALELLTLSAAGLVALSPKDPYGFSALRYLLVALIASLLYLLGVGLMYGTHATLDIDLLSQRASADTLHAIAALCITLGLMMKAALVPLHSWLPQAHSRASPSVSAMLSAVVVAVALYWLWQLWQGPFKALGMQPFFAFLGSLSIVWGGINALQQTQLKRLIAYSTIAQMGYALLVLSLAPDASAYPLALQGATTLLVAHGVAKAGLFITAGYLVAYHQSDQLQQFTGSAHRFPWLWVAFALSAASLVGLPPSGGFVGKWWLFIGLWEQQRWLSATAFLLGTLLTAAYLTRVMAIALRPAPSSRPKTTPNCVPALIPLLLGGLVWGIGIILLAQHGYFSLPGMDRTTRFFAFPALIIWPLILFWQYRSPSPPTRFFSVVLWLSALLHIVALTSQEWLTFYTALAWLGVLGWLLILHGTTASTPQAARTYLAMMLVAEVLLFAATASIALQGTLAFEQTTFATLSTGTALLIGSGMAIKSGMLGVHGWLPIAHPAAPALASALLSGVMIKLGVLGVLRLTPESASGIAAGQMLFYWGVLAALYGGLRGACSKSPKTVLAWSSVGQIGLLSAGLGALLWLPENGALRTALMLLVVSHGLAKSALFIGAGQWGKLSRGHRQLIGSGMAVSALTLIGAPFSGGLYIKSWLTLAINAQGFAGDLLTLASLATAGAMLRFGWLLKQQPPANLSTEPEANGWLWCGWFVLCSSAWLVPLIWLWWLPYPGSWLAANLTALGIVSISGGLAVAIVYLRAILTIPPFRLPSIPPLPWHQASRFRPAWVVERKSRHWTVIGLIVAIVSAIFIIIYLYVINA